MKHPRRGAVDCTNSSTGNNKNWATPVIWLLPLTLIACSTPSQRPGSEPHITAQHATPLGSKAQPVLPAAGSGRGGYYLDDGPGDNIPANLDAIADAEPRVEPFAKGPSKPYSVFGKAYVPLTDNTTPFKQRGIGSWYGKKFHNQKTASGERYDMYKMTAAHPTLPVPSYARVTNLKNGAQVIVRINDRGPFHSNRIIDLSYTAALKLGYLGSGSGELEVERLLPDDIERLAAARRADPTRLAAVGPGISTAAAKTTTFSSGAENTRAATVANPLLTGGGAGSATVLVPVTAAAAVVVETLPPLPASASAVLVSGYYLQFGAYTQEVNAQAARATLMQTLSGLVSALSTVPSNGLYRLYAGPYVDRAAAHDVAILVRERSGIAAFVIENK